MDFYGDRRDARRPSSVLPGLEALVLQLEPRRGEADCSAMPGIKNTWMFNELFQELFGLPLRLETSLFT